MSLTRPGLGSTFFTEVESGLCFLTGRKPMGFYADIWGSRPVGRTWEGVAFFLRSDP